MRGPSGRWSISKRYAGAMAELIFACMLLAGCNIFSMVGILDNAPSGGSSTLKLVPEAANIPAGGTKQFTAVGGSGGYIYSVEAGGAGNTINASGLYTAVFLGTDSVLVTDSMGSECTATAMVVSSVPLSISPSTVILDAHGSVTFSANGGSGVGYSFSILSGGGSIVGATYTAPWSADTPVIRVTDSVSNTADAAVTVNAPTVVHISPITRTLNVGQNVTFTGSGGSGSYSFTKDSGAGTLVGATYTAPGVAETAKIRVTDTNTTGTEVATVTVNAPAALVINPSAPTLDVGQNVTFTGSGGSGNPANYSYSLFSGGGTFNGVTHIYTAPGSGTTAVIRLTDTLTFPLQPPVDATVTVNPPATLVINPASASIYDTGSVTFTASGGSGNPANYSYSTVSALGSLVGSTYTPQPGSPEVAVIRLTDILTFPLQPPVDATVNVTVPPGLAISPKTITIDVGGTVTLTATGGIPPYSYAKQSGGGTFNGVTHVYTAPWSATTAVIRVTDSGIPSTDNATVTVNLPLLVISPSTTTLNVGQTVTFTGSGGSNNPANYSYSLFSGGGTFNGVTHIYTAPGSGTTAVIRLTDTLTFPLQPPVDATVTVNAPAALVISPSTTTLNVGQNVTFTGSGGSGNPANYSYSKISGAGTLVGATYTAPGVPETATIQLKDSLTTQTVDATVAVNAPLPLTITPLTVNVLAGNAVTFTPGGGSGSYSFSLVSGTGTLVGATYTTISDETSKIRLTDTITSNTLDATVVAYFPLAIVPTDATVQQGDTYSFDASGGVPPYTYSVIPPAGMGSIDADGTYHASGAAGSATVKVVDSLSNSSTADVTVTAVVSWIIQSIDTASRSGQYASLALSGTGVPQIAYYESRNKELRLEKLIGSVWTRQTVDTTGFVGQYASLGLDASANARISYYDAKNKDLKYASWNGSSWTKQTVDSGGDLGMYSSLALDGSGKPRISYYDSTNNKLKYASWNGSSWTKQTVDSGGNVGMYSSLALDAGGNPHISYYDAGNKQLKYVSAIGTVWGAPQTVDSGNVGMYSSLAFDGSGNAHISYYDAGNKHLKYASWNGSSWGVPQTVDPSNNVGMYSSLKLDASGKARIAYYNSSSQDLKYAKEQ